MTISVLQITDPRNLSGILYLVWSFCNVSSITLPAQPALLQLGFSVFPFSPNIAPFTCLSKQFFPSEFITFLFFLTVAA